MSSEWTLPCHQPPTQIAYIAPVLRMIVSTQVEHSLLPRGARPSVTPLPLSCGRGKASLPHWATRWAYWTHHQKRENGRAVGTQSCRESTGQGRARMEAPPAEWQVLNAMAKDPPSLWLPQGRHKNPCLPVLPCSIWEL